MKLPFFVVAFSISLAANAQEVGRCDKAFSASLNLKHLEAPTEELESWIRGKNHEALERLSKSENKAAIEEYLWQLNDHERTVSDVELQANVTLKLIDRGLGKATELVRVSARGLESKPIFSTYSLKRNNSFTGLELSVSKNEKYAAISMVEKGSTDLYRIALVELQTGRILYDLASSSQEVPWVGPDTFQVEVRQGQANVVYEVKIGESGQPVGQYLLAKSGKWSVIHRALSKTDGEYVFQHEGGYKFATKDAEPLSIVGQSGNHVYFKARGKNKNGEIRRLLVVHNKDKTGASEIFAPATNEVIGNSWLSGDRIFVEKSLGRDIRVEVFNAEGEIVGQVPIPECCSVVSAGLKSGTQNIVIVKLRSLLKSKETFEFDLRSGEFKGQSPQGVMLRSGNQYFTSQVVNVSSQDGTQIPVRITHLKGIELKGENPSLISAYGGFRNPHRFYPRYDGMFLEFLKRGGVVVDPAVRGGNENGESWHEQATFKNKHLTLEDLSATAEYLKAEGYSKREKIATWGASNGGMVVASAGLKFPQSFGLVISINGVQDMLGKDHLNPEHGKGWSYEYGSGQDPEMIPYLSTISPVELAAAGVAGRPDFLILTGRQDSRVHPAHSYKLAEAMGGYGQLYVINNSGHWLNSPSYQNLIGWRANVVIWSRIFDQMGLKF